MGYFVLPKKVLNEMQKQTLRRIIELKPHTADIICRKDGKDYQFEADWLKLIEEVI